MGKDMSLMLVACKRAEMANGQVSVPTSHPGCYARRLLSCRISSAHNRVARLQLEDFDAENRRPGPLPAPPIGAPHGRAKRLRAGQCKCPATSSSLSWLPAPSCSSPQLPALPRSFPQLPARSRNFQQLPARMHGCRLRISCCWLPFVTVRLATHPLVPRDHW